MKSHEWTVLSLDAACWMLFDSQTRKIEAIIVGHVDGLLFGGNKRV